VTHPPPPLEVACVGDNCVDVALDRSGDELAGGNAFNVAVELARAGRGVSYLGAVGDDASGRLIRQTGLDAGVDMAGLRTLPGATGRTVVDHLPGGERVFVSEEYGASADYRLDAAALAALGTRRWVHFAREEDAPAHAPALADAGVLLSCDFGDTDDVAAIAPLCASLHVAFVSEPSGDNAAAQRLLDALAAAGADVAVVTLGVGGSLARAGERRWHQPAVPVEHVVDTLGAGDAFIAAFVGALLDQPDDISFALSCGAVAGAAACTRIGLASPPPPTEVTA
jgi:fructoselysine 6-kinase